ncbi:MAG: acyl-CoA dehydrogenase family protein [bacterium]
MNFEYNEDQRVFKDSISKYLLDNYEFEERQKVVASEEPFSAEVWGQTAELGWLYMPFSEEQGGLSGTPIDTMLMFEEFGRYLVIEPYLETLVLTGGVLRRVDNALAAEKIESLMMGGLQGAVAHFEAQSRGAHENIATSAQASGDGFVIQGQKPAVYNAPVADILVVSAKMPDGGMGLFLVEKDTAGLSVNAYPTVDGHVAAEVTLDNVQVSSAQLLASGDEAMKVLQDVYDEALLALTAEMVGAMDVLLKATVDYTKERKQFGTTLSKFQVLQHHMADMFMAGELARSLMYAAAIKLRDGSDDASAFIAAAKAKADKSARQVAYSAIQLHGGIATTEELNVGHYLKRITVASQIFGTTKYHLKRYSQLTGA